MLTLESTNDALEALYSTSKEVAEELYAILSPVGERMVLKADTNLLTLVKTDKILYITEGYFRLLYGKKVVRLYSENDFIGGQHHFENVSVVSEFASEVVAFKWQDVEPIFQANPGFANMWYRLLDYENKINLGLCAQLVDERVQPSLELRQFREGEVIIEEQSDPAEIYEMISGSAKVTLAGHEVGKIGTGEIFGEMSFLVGSPRTATVTAAAPCCVRVVDKDDFFSLIEVDRHLSASIAKTLAARVIELNRRLTTLGV